MTRSSWCSLSLSLSFFSVVFVLFLFPFFSAVRAFCTSSWNSKFTSACFSNGLLLNLLFFAFSFDSTSCL